MKSIVSILCICLSLSLFSQSNSNDNSNKEHAAAIVQQHIAPFNNRNLEQFANAFDTHVLVNRFPNDTMYLGRDKLKENYARFFKENKKSNVKVLNRMVLKNVVIDEELGTVNYKTNRHITIYETDHEDINSMTFLHNSKTTSNPESIVNKQLEAYNKGDIDAFVATYSSNIKLYRYPNNLTSEGHEAIRSEYASFFKKAPDLNAQIVNRMVLGNKVIDNEKVTFNGNTFYAIAIYEVQNGKITKVTFIQ
ncbi:nuclear transport factor 2 family protein [Flavivirga spongiicola]|uniref:Nuclear transport factor 2 family protein n=1 Tax=Flavivirga spongiicola TaxID=421621 RepID=A0ABU7XPR8_9FLAO|nr:nuclear transport factor 2 family protein [Flavivirga sp. MEBiC05379]MDO5977764.1 nuclear transport factor 2 family protein [Flavivirga sp. MEBiC05379]